MVVYGMVQTMKITDPDTVSDEMPPEYRFDYALGRPNRFAPSEPAPITVNMKPEVRAKSRRKPPRVVSLPRLVVPVGLGLVLALSVAGFVFYTKITLYQEAHFAPESAHPWDGYAALCLFLAMAATAGLLLNKRDPPPMRWRRGRVLIHTKRRAKRRRAGTIPLS